MVAISQAAGGAASIGYSLSPGGLLLPYHLGALASLSYNGRLPDAAHLAGSSAGAIAVASHASLTKPEEALEACINVSEACANTGGGQARGRLLPLLKKEMDGLLRDDAHTLINEREGVVALAHRELFPRNRPVLTTYFRTRDELIESVCDSSMFPFFATQWPVRLRKYPGEAFGWRIVVDGFFTVPRERYGCPDFDHLNFDAPRRATLIPQDDNKATVGSLAEELEEEFELMERSGLVVPADKDDVITVDRTVTVSVFPHDTVGLTASESHDQIGPEPEYENAVGQMTDLLRLATQPSSREELTKLYEDGWKDAEKWCSEEDQRQREMAKDQRAKQRQIENVSGDGGGARFKWPSWGMASK